MNVQDSSISSKHSGTVHWKVSTAIILLYVAQIQPKSEGEKTSKARVIKLSLMT